MDLGVFYEVIVPLLEVKDTALICISTPLDSWNFYSQLTEVRDEKGRRLFNVRHVQKGARPAWKPDEGLSKMRAIYGKARKAMLETEIYGMIARATGSAFNRRLLTDFFDAAPCEEPHPINDNCIYVSIDPNGGAKASNASGSDTAIVSFFLSRGRVVICGLEAHETADNDEAYAILKAHLRALRGQRCLQRGGTRFRIILEANLGDFAQQVGKRVIANISDADVVCTHQHCYGVFTGPTSKPKYVFKMREKLRERALVYHSRLVSVNPYADPDLPRAELAVQMRRQFEQQLGAFRTVFNVPKALLSTVRVTYSGKADRDNMRTTRTQDDLGMALLFGYYYASLLVADTGGVFTRSQRNALSVEQPAFLFQ